MIKQIHWRLVGGIAVVVSLVMVFVGTQLDGLRESLLAFTTYWVVVLVLLGIALYCAFLDIRYIRLQYTAARRELFHETLGNEAFRKHLKGRSETKSDDDGRSE